MHKIIIFHFLIAVCVNSYCQSPTPDFSVADACRNEIIVLDNNSLNAESYLWDFCMNDLSSVKELTTSVKVSASVIPTGITTINDKDKWYGFLSSRDNNKIFRLDYGTSLENTPIVTDLGNIGNLLNGPQNIEFIEEGGVYYALVLNYGAGNILRLTFSAGLNNTPTANVIGNFGLSNPRGLDLINNGTEYFAMISDYNNNRLVVLDFSGSITNSPTAQGILDGQILKPLGVRMAIVNGNFYAVVASYGSNRIVRVNFGSSFYNIAPTIDKLYDVVGPTEISLSLEGSFFHIYSTSEGGNLSHIKLSDNLMSVIGSDNLGKLGVLANTFGFDLVRASPIWYALTVDYGTGQVYLLKFDGECTEISEKASTEQSPSLSYSISGTYSVDLTAYSADGSHSSVSHDVNIGSLAAPDLEITRDNLCVNGITTFAATDNTGGTLVSWNWSLDDGVTSTAAMPTHSYITVGQYGVSLKANAANGCSNQITKTINIYNPPTSSFTLPTNNPLCTNQQFTFPNTSTFDVGSSPAWEWFVNGTSVSTTKNLQQSFSSATAQTIKLKASIPGCFSESTQVINSLLAGPQLGFTVAGMCEGDAVTFNNTTTDPVLGFAWDFGDSQSSTSTDASHTYSTHGNYTVSLQASNANGCQNTVTKNIVLYTKPQSDFSLSLPPFSCSGSVSQFNDLTANPTDSNIASWAWNFGDVGNAQNTSTQKNAQHTYAVAGDYSVALTTKTNRGCLGTTQKQVTIAQSPQADFTNTPACRDVPVVFTDASKGTITSWYWQMDNTFYFVAEPKPTHIFTNSKTYPVSLTVTASNNCISVVNKNLIVPLPLVPSFTVEKNCTDQNTSFIDMTNSIADPIQSYNWQFANFGTATGSPAQFTFSTAGNYDVTMNMTTLSGCTYSATSKINIVQGPLASFKASPETGVPPLEVQFDNTSANAKYYAWAFNDNSSSPISEENSPKHTFIDFGEYVVDLTASNDLGCTNTISKIIKTVLPSKDISIIALNAIKNADGSLKVIATLKNNGNVPLQNLPLVADVSGLTSIRESVAGPIAPAATFNYTFTYEILLTKGLDFLCGDIQLDDDVNATDNIICTSLSNTFYLYAPYPNPVNNIINLDWINPNAEPLQVEIYDAMSKLVATYNYQGEAGLNQADLSVEILKNGIYVFRISTATTSKIYKIAIAH